MLELCPTSNLQTRAVSGVEELRAHRPDLPRPGGEAHPEHRRPYLLDTDMEHEVALVEQHAIMTPAQVEQSLAWAREYSFIP